MYDSAANIAVMLYLSMRQRLYCLARAGHELAVDLQHDQLYCAACNTYVYDATFNAAIKVDTRKPSFYSHPSLVAITVIVDDDQLSVLLLL